MCIGCSWATPAWVLGFQPAGFRFPSHFPAGSFGDPGAIICSQRHPSYCCSFRLGGGLPGMAPTMRRKRKKPPSHSGPLESPLPNPVRPRLPQQGPLLPVPMQPTLPAAPVTPRGGGPSAPSYSGQASCHQGVVGVPPSLDILDGALSDQWAFQAKVLVCLSSIQSHYGTSSAATTALSSGALDMGSWTGSQQEPVGQVVPYEEPPQGSGKSVTRQGAWPM